MAIWPQTNPKPRPKASSLRFVIVPKRDGGCWPTAVDTISEYPGPRSTELHNMYLIVEVYISKQTAE